jgi:pullulanase
VVDTRNADAPVIKVYREDLFAATPIYLRGEVSSAGWGDTNSTNNLVYQGKGIYALTLGMAAGTYQFKVAEANWTNPNLGGSAVILGEPGELIQGSNDNLSITIPSAGNYRFTVDTTSPNAITLTVVAVGN